MSRALLNDPELSKFISANFVPLAASIEALQPSRYGGQESESSRWFVGLARQAFEKYAPKGWWEEFKSYQGTQVARPAQRHRSRSSVRFASSTACAPERASTSMGTTASAVTTCGYFVTKPRPSCVPATERELAMPYHPR